MRSDFKESIVNSAQGATKDNSNLCVLYSNESKELELITFKIQFF